MCVGNIVKAAVNQSSGVYSSGFPGSGSYDIQGSGLTADGSIGKGSSQRLFSNAFQGYVVGRSSDGQIWVAADTFDGVWNFANGASVQGYSDSFTTQKWLIAGATGNISTQGNLALGQSTTAVATATAGTIATANLGTSLINPAGAITGVILASGTIAGQKCTVINESAFSVTFAASGTSHVAQGVSLVIAANGKYDFSWDSTKSLWY